jgi:hypothetical protein
MTDLRSKLKITPKETNPSEEKKYWKVMKHKQHKYFKFK